MPDTQTPLNPSINPATDTPSERRNVGLICNSHLRITFPLVIGGRRRLTVVRKFLKEQRSVQQKTQKKIIFAEAADLTGGCKQHRRQR